LLICDRPVPG